MKTRTNLKVLYSTIFLFVSSFSTFAGNEVLLRLNLEKGDFVKYRSENTQVITKTMGGMNQVVDQSQTVDYTINVAEKEDDGNVLVDIIYNRIAVRVTAHGTEMKFDSDNDANQANQNPQFMGFSALVGKTIRSRISQNSS